MDFSASLREANTPSKAQLDLLLNYRQSEILYMNVPRQFRSSEQYRVYALYL